VARSSKKAENLFKIPLKTSPRKKAVLISLTNEGKHCDGRKGDGIGYGGEEGSLPSFRREEPAEEKKAEKARPKPLTVTLPGPIPGKKKR